MKKPLKYVFNLFSCTTHSCNCRHNIFSCVPARIASVLLLLLLSGFVNAKDAARAEALESIYDHAGVHAHLSWVHTTVAEETKIAWQRCENEQQQAQIQALLEENLSIESLRLSFLDELNQRIDEEQLVQIMDWVQSEAGKNIYQAEVESLDLDESRFGAILEEYKQSDVHGDERNSRLKLMLADTGAVYFLSALNTELSALVSIASVCSNNEDDLAAAHKQIREDRGAETLYRSFMRQELIMPSAIVYRNISDNDLDALSEFANSDAGDAYYTALIKGTRSVLSGKVDRLSKTLETISKNKD